MNVIYKAKQMKTKGLPVDDFCVHCETIKGEASLCSLPMCETCHYCSPCAEKTLRNED